MDEPNARVPERGADDAILEKWSAVAMPLPEAQFGAAVAELSQAVRSALDAGSVEGRGLAARGLMLLANLHRDHGHVLRALPLYDEALLHSTALDDGSPGGVNEMASIVTHSGICLLATGRPEDLVVALTRFDRAIDLRKGLPLDDEPLYRRGLAAGYMNRGDVLTRLHGRSQVAAQAYDDAIHELEKLAWEGNPDLSERMAVAWSNRGLAAEEAADAVASFDRAVTLLTAPASPSARQRMILCHTRLNRGRLLLQETGDPPGAAADARAVLADLSGMEREFPAAAEMSLHARHLLCRALCVSLEDGKAASVAAGDWIMEATAQVDEALALERHWEGKKLHAFRAITAELFQLGLRIHRVCQPELLAGFLLDGVDPARSPGAPADDAAFLHAAALALKLGLDDAVVRAAAATLEPELHGTEMAILQELKRADVRLAALQAGAI